MRALTFDGALALRDDLPRPRPHRGEALVRVSLAGICATDLAILQGYMGFNGVLGHEFVGVVEEASDPDWVGRRVVGEINAACGRCTLCHEGLSRHCPERTVLGITGRDGAFAEYLSLPLANLHTVPDEVSDVEAVFVEPLAAAFRILEQIPVRAGQQAFVLGDGRLGLLVAQVLQGVGCAVTLIGRHPHKLALAGNWGVSTLCLARGEAPGLEPADLVVECTGAQDGLERAVSLTRPCGTVVLKTTCADAPSYNPAPIVIHEITVLGSRCGPFGPALKALAAGTVRVAPLVAATFPLAEGRAALARAASPGTLKVLLAP